MDGNGTLGYVGHIRSKMTQYELGREHLALTVALKRDVKGTFVAVDGLFGV